MKAVKLFGVSVLAGVLSIVPLSSALAAGNKQVVQASNLALPPNATTTQDSWYFYNDNSNTPSTAEAPGSYEFVNGPGTPRSGYGSLKFSAGAGDRWNIATNQFAGKDLDEIEKLSMTIYRPSTSPDWSLFFNFDVDFNNTTTDGYQGRLVYVPDDNGIVNEDNWQKWNMNEGSWRWSRFAANGNKWLDNNPTELRSWSDIKSAFPNAEVLNETFTGQALIRGGHPGPAGLVGYLDSFSLDNKSWDFETDECVFVTQGNRYKLMNDCVTTSTILIPDGMTLDGNWNTITAKDPTGGHFLGAVVKNAGANASVVNLQVYAGGLTDACDAGADRLRGILLEGASGEVKHVKILAVNQGNSGCQEGNGIEVRNFGPGDTDITTGPRKVVKIHGNQVSDYQKTGILANGYITASITNNIVSNGFVTNTLIAANSLQAGFGVDAEIKNNKIEGNQYCGPADTVATAVLAFEIANLTVQNNSINGNSDTGLYLEYSGTAQVKSNSIKDEGSDCNVNGYDIGIGNYGPSSSNQMKNTNKIQGFSTLIEE